ncbi:MAG: CPBP family intramembrane metalloprotease [Phycisphaerales bacterium]|nr:CPBP family intramembrane metalloprotease [Phycisphaerales bacterium]
MQRTPSIAPFRRSDLWRSTVLIAALLAAPLIAWRLYAGLQMDAVLGTGTPPDEIFAYPSSGVDWSFIVVCALFNGLAEELSVRAYLISPRDAAWIDHQGGASLYTRVRDVPRVLRGWGVFSLFFIGLVLGVAFAWTRRLWPTALGHAGWTSFPSSLARRYRPVGSEISAPLPGAPGAFAAPPFAFPRGYTHGSHLRPLKAA